ncbi:hypothetical protein HJC23_013755 [Cyclotella cryptica]|uniref:Uncharacterized protein n=1 Tax=Cyclotella cryptica TaxID=29204 RepID=A0ABD3NTQ9_9STRA|eukprot:CCRYP_020369-RA/>CCRYP_020369-RA protein AED:0.43 eAED:0.43 QI:0/-1/0/1/-1/1/1/0/181
MNLSTFIAFAVNLIVGAFHNMGDVEAFVSPTSRLTYRPSMHSANSALEPTSHDNGSDHTNFNDEPKITEKLPSRRRAILSILGGSVLSPLLTNADEPSNLYYKSKADEEDPIAVFGKTLQDMSFENTAGNDVNKDGPSSFSDIALPSYLPPATEGGAGDLNKALLEKKLEQKRRVDPRTHG